MLPSFECRDRGRQVHVIRRRDVDELELRVAGHVLPTRRPRLPTEARGEEGQLVAVTPAGSVENDAARKVEEPIRLAPRVAVRAAHELLTDETDEEFVRHALGTTSGESIGVGRGLRRNDGDEAGGESCLKGEIAVVRGVESRLEDRVDVPRNVTTLPRIRWNHSAREEVAGSRPPHTRVGEPAVGSTSSRALSAG